jgi:hypothetical protein
MSAQAVVLTLDRDPAEPSNSEELHLRTDAPSLATCLSRLDASTVTVRAPWDRLTGHLMQDLADWAAERPQRGCGVVPSDSPAGRYIAGDAAPIALLSDETACRALTSAGLRTIALEDGLELLASSTPPVAVALTGHGGEHCIAIGDRWIGTYSAAALPGVVMAPEAITCGAAFLNTCGSLRLVDSVVPRRYSLASRLHARGAGVVGAFRNQLTFAHAGEMFARQVMLGMPLGAVVNSLNRESRRLGHAAVSYQLLGDASSIVSNAVLPNMDRVEASRCFSDSLLDEVGWLDQAYRTLASWRDLSPDAESAYRDFARARRMVHTAVHAARTRLTDVEIGTLEWVARESLATGSARLLDEMSRLTLDGIWPQAAWAPVSQPPVVCISTCGRCRGRSLRYEFAPIGRGLHGGRSIDCDRCGTVHDVVGSLATTPTLIEVSHRGEALDVSLPPLDADCIGKVTIHRSRSVAPQPWPRDGGIVTFPVRSIPFRGKTTVTASRIGASFLALDYATVFVAPS